MSRYLITGGAGFIGSNLAMALEKEGHEAVVLDNFLTGHFKNLRGFLGEVISGSIVDKDWAASVGKVDGVFHQAAITDTTVEDQALMVKINVDGFRNVLNFAKDQGLKNVVYASSAGVYGNGPAPMLESQDLTPENVYGFSKMVMDRVAMNFAKANKDIRVVGLRYFNVYGPREDHKGNAASMIYQLSLQMKAGKRPRVFKFGEQSRDFIYVKDVLQANFKALNAKSSGVFNVGTGVLRNFNAIIDCLNATLKLDLSADYFENPYSFYQNKTQADLRRISANLDYRPEFSLEEGIEDYFGSKEVRTAVA